MPTRRRTLSIVIPAAVVVLTCAWAAAQRGRLYTSWVLSRMTAQTTLTTDERCWVVRTIGQPTGFLHVDRVTIYEAMDSSEPAPAWSYAGCQATLSDALCRAMAHTGAHAGQPGDPRAPPAIFPQEVIPQRRAELLDAWKHYAWHQYLREDDRQRCLRIRIAAPCEAQPCATWRSPTTAWIERYDYGRMLGDGLTIDPIQ